MPQLPKGNSLDYNPDATIMASKKLTSIALERMKNPLEDPDQSTLSTLQTQKQLDDSFERLDGMAGNFEGLVLRLAGLLGKAQTKSREKYFPVEMEEARELATGSGRKKKRSEQGSSKEHSSQPRRRTQPSNIAQAEYLLLNLPEHLVIDILNQYFTTPDDYTALHRLLRSANLSSRPFVLNAIRQRINELERQLGLSSPVASKFSTTTPPSTPKRRDRRDDEDDGDGGEPQPPVAITTMPFGLMGTGRRRMIRGGSNGSSVTSDTTGSSISVGEYLRNLRHDRRRFRDFYNDDERNSSATPSAPPSTPSAPPFTPPPQNPDYFEPDLDDAFEMPTGRSPMMRNPVPLYSKDGQDYVGEEKSFNSLIFPIINLTRQMNILISSRIKPVIPSLSGEQISKLSQIYEMVKNSYNDIVFPESRRARSKTAPKPDLRPYLPLGVRRATDLEENLIEENQFGDQILSVWNTERQSLLLTLTVIINSWKQNTPTGQQMDFNERLNKSFEDTTYRIGQKADLVAAQGERPSETFDYENVAGLEGGLDGAGRRRRGRPKKSGSMTLIGCGNNFYGEKINNSRDIPSLFSGSLRACATKYML